MKYTFEEYKKICFRDHVLKTLTYYKLKRLMALFHSEMSEQTMPHRRKSLTSWKTAKVMSQTLMMFYLMFEEIKENITLDSFYYQRMSDLISIYIDLEIKASEESSEGLGSLSSRIICVMEKFLDHQHRFILDTLLKSHNICRKFREISTLIISRVLRNLPSTKHSEQSFIRSMLVFKLWIQITKGVEGRANIFKLASHLAKPPKDLMKAPSQLALDILPSNFHKCYMDLTTYIIGTPGALRKKIKVFLEHTRIVETQLPKKSFFKSSETAEEQKNEEFADIKVLKEILFGLTQIIKFVRKQKKTIRSLKNSHYRYATIEELEGRASLPLEYTKICKKDISTQTPTEQNEYLFLHSKIMNECINEFFKRMVRQTNMETVQNQEKEEMNSLNNNIVPGIPITNGQNNFRNAEYLQQSIPSDVTNLMNFDSSRAEQKKTNVTVHDSNVNIQNNAVAVSEANRKKNKDTENEMVSTISVRPAAIISNHLDNVSSKSITAWHTPEVHCQPNVSSYNTVLPSHRMPMASGLMNTGSNEVHRTVPELPSTKSALPFQQDTPSNVSYEQPNPYENLMRSNVSLRPTNGSLPPAPINHHPELSLTHGPPTTLLNGRTILKSNFMNDSFPGCRDDKVLVKDTSVQYYPPLSKNNSNPASFNQGQGMNSVAYHNQQMQQSHPMPFNQYNRRLQYPQMNGSFPFYNNTNFAPRIMGTQHQFPNIAGPNSLMTRNVGPQHLPPFSLQDGNNDEPTTHVDQARRRGRGSRISSTAQCTGTNLSSSPPSINSNPNADNPAMRSWPNIPPQYNNSLRTLDYKNMPNASSQTMLRPPAPASNTTQNVGSTKLPPYSSIRRKNNSIFPPLPISDSPSNYLPMHTTHYNFPNPNAPIAMQVTSSQPFPPVNNNSFSLPVMNTPYSLTTTNASVSEPITVPSTSLSVPTTPETNSEVIKSNNCYRTTENDPKVTSFGLYQNVLTLALHKAISVLTHKNELGFLEYNFKKMPIPLQAFKDALTYIEKLGGNNNAIDIIDDIVSSLSQANESFVNDKNMFPPQLLKVNNNDINIGKLEINIGQEEKKRHEVTLHNDHLTFVYQDKIRTLYSNCNGISPDDFQVKSDLCTRCYCLQCCTNKIVLDVNLAILKQFRHYQISINTKEDEITEALKKTGVSKRALEKSAEESDSPLPLKKRFTSTPPDETRLSKDSDVSYPSTPMISIAELELLKNISTNILENKTDSVATIPIDNVCDDIVEAQSSAISNMSTNKPISETATYQFLENNESQIIPNTENNILRIQTSPNLPGSPIMQSSVTIKSSQYQVNNSNKKPVRRYRKNEKRDGKK